MKLTFTYDKAKDVWCLFHKGKMSNNSPTPTKMYEQIMQKYGESPTEKQIAEFVDIYIKENNIMIEQRINIYTEEWNTISPEFQKRAEQIFGVILPEEFTAYLTINNRFPYNFEESYFYVSMQSNSVRKTAMHELWHFYTWYWVGKNEGIEKIGAHKFNDLKEALTVLLNVECKDLLPEAAVDMGYPQHQELREKILAFWEHDKNIHNLWNYLIAE